MKNDPKTLDVWLRDLIKPYNYAFKLLTTTGECTESEAITIINTYMKESRNIANRTLESLRK